jgi:hypothetical protein
MKGEVIYLYAFDVANEIVTGKVREILASTPVPYEIRTDHTLPKDIPLYKPLSIEHTPFTSSIDGLQIRPSIRVYDFGVVSIAMRIAFDVSNFTELTPFHNLKLMNGQTLDQLARALCIETCKSLKEAMIQSAPMLVQEPEAYTIFCLTDIGSTKPLPEWTQQNRESIAELLTENKPGFLSQMQVDEVLRMQRTYSNQDLTIIDWDAAA